MDIEALNNAVETVQDSVRKGQTPPAIFVDYLADHAPHLLFNSVPKENLTFPQIDRVLRAVTQRDEPNPNYQGWHALMPFMVQLGKGAYNHILIPRFSELGQGQAIRALAIRMADIPQAPNSFAALIEIAQTKNYVGEIPPWAMNDYLKACAAEHINQDSARESYTRQWAQTSYFIVRTLESAHAHKTLFSLIAERYIAHGLARILYQELHDGIFPKSEENPDGTEDLFASHHRFFSQLLKNHAHKNVIVQNALAIAYFHLETDILASTSNGGTHAPQKLQQKLQEAITQKAESLGVKIDMATLQSLAQNHQTALSVTKAAASTNATPPTRPSGGF